MPELPEVETIRRTLSPKIQGKKILQCKIFYKNCIKEPSVKEFISKVEGTTIIRLGRRGKYLKIYLNTGKILLIHLRMTGRLIVCQGEDEVTKHTHVIFNLEGDLQLRFIDIRKFGTIYLLSPEELDKVHGYAILGPEPFDDEFTLNFLKSKLKKRKTYIKNVLLDQKIVAGIGNIYADEILHSAGIKPSRRADTLNDEEIKKLYHSIKLELKKGIENRGTSFSDYVDAEGNRGKNQDFLQVYQKEGTCCGRCGCKILKERLGGRGTHYCPECQK